MSDYGKLVKELRGCKEMDYCTDCPRMANGYVEFCNIKEDAAAAIEALQAEVKRLNMRCADCEYGNSEWPEDPEHTKMPKRGEWVRVREVDIPGEMHPVAYRCMCQTCRNEYVFPRIPQYCPDCGSMNTAKMEVQDEIL